MRNIVLQQAPWQIIDCGVQYIELDEITETYGNDIIHGFCTKNGGVSQGPYQSLNCCITSNDDIGDIVTNIALVQAAFCQGIEADYGDYYHSSNSSYEVLLKITQQVHSNKVIEITEPNLNTTDLKADALVTKLPGILLGVQTADCIPILLYDWKNKIVASLHAGWRGALNGIIQNTINTIKGMQGDVKSTIAMIGPGIDMHHYEVDDIFYSQFLQEDISNNEFFSHSFGKHYYFNLRGYCIKVLIDNGIIMHNIHNLAIDTYANEQMFFSCRRAKQEAKVYGKKPIFGGQLSVIGLSPN